MADKTVKKNKTLNEPKNSKTTRDRGIASTELLDLKVYSSLFLFMIDRVTLFPCIFHIVLSQVHQKTIYHTLNILALHFYLIFFRHSLRKRMGSHLD